MAAKKRLEKKVIAERRARGVPASDLKRGLDNQPTIRGSAQCEPVKTLEEWRSMYIDAHKRRLELQGEVHALNSKVRALTGLLKAIVDGLAHVDHGNTLDIPF